MKIKGVQAVNKKKIVVMIAVLIVLAAAGSAIGISISNQKNAERQAKIEHDQDSFNQALLQMSRDTIDELNTHRIYPGVYFMNVDLGGLTKEEAKRKIINEANEQIFSKELVLKRGDDEWIFTYEELGMWMDTQALVEEAFAIGRSGNLRQRKQMIQEVKENKVVLEAKTRLDDSTLQRVMEQLAEEAWQDPEDATISLEGKTFTVTDDKPGAELDIPGTKKKVIAALKAENSSKEISLKMNKVEAERTAKELSTIRDVIGTYTTAYSTGNSGREENLKIGSGKVNGTVLMPGETFYFNPTVGPITAEQGYKEAAVIIDGEYGTDLGGGLCQVSSTLYNAVIRAELGVDFRDCHAFPSSYVPMGLDATVAEGYIDFIFTNTTDHPVYLSMWCNGGELGATIYGTETRDLSRKISFDYTIKETIPKPEPEIEEDKSLAPGSRVVVSQGQVGYEVEVYKTVTENGVSQTEWFSSSSYIATPDKIKVGPDKN